MLKLVGGAAIVAGSFFATLQIINYLSLPADPNADVIHVAAATYGMNCNGFKMPSGAIADVKTGNVTAAVSKQCDGAKETCDYLVDVTRLGDFARGCAKDFSVEYHCDASSDLRTSRLLAEANGKTIYLSCP